MTPEAAGAPAWCSARHAPVAVTLALVFSLASVAVAAEKTDVLVMLNGDTITGEVKSLRQGKLSFKTDDLGTLNVNWDRVASLVSRKAVEVEAADASLHFGVLEQPSREGVVALRSDSGVHELEIEQVVRISPISTTFWKGLNGSFSLGGSFTKSSDVLQLSVAADASHRTRKRLTHLSLNAISTDQVDSTTQNIDGMLSLIRLLAKRWLAGGLVTYQRNQSLGIENRILLAGGGGRQLVETPRQEFVILGGINANLEDTTAVDAGLTSWEAFLTLHYARFSYHHPKQNFTTRIMAFPSLTESGRLRAQFSMDWRQEIVTDFFFELTLYGTYDSQPPQGALLSTDYGIVTSLGYSFSP